MALALLGPCLWAQKEGEQIWAYKVGGYISLSSAAVSPDGSRIYVGVSKGIGSGNSSGLLSVAPSGEEGWKIVLPAAIDSSPALSPDGRTVYVGCTDGKLYAFDTTTRLKKWETRSFISISSSPAIGADGTLYVGAWDTRLHAIDPETGREQWSVPTGDYIDLSSPAIAADGTIYVGSYDKNVYAVTPAGEKKWEYATGGSIVSSPAIGADGTIYIGSSDQYLHAITPDGKRKWAFFTNGDIQASPILGADGLVYIASADTHFYGLNPDGPDETRVNWMVDIGVTAASTAVVRGDGIIIFGADDGKVRALDPRDRNIIWTFDTKTREDDYIDSSPMLGPDGSIYIGSTNGFLYKIKGNGSPLSMQSSWPAFHRDPTHTGRAVATNNGGQLFNIATRARVRGSDTLIAGFVVQGAPTGRAYLLRAVGPGLAAQGVSEFQPDPSLQLFSGSVLLQMDDDWTESDSVSGFGIADAFPAVGAFPLEPGSKDAAILRPLGSGAFSAVVHGADGTGGVALVEVYDAFGGDQSARLVNLSTRGRVGTGDDVMIAGFVLRGPGSRRLLLRGIGPGLAQFGVPGSLSQPRLEVFSGSKSFGSNTGWTSTGYKNDLAVAAESVLAFPLADGSADCALLFDANPGPTYTIQVSGVNGTTGEALVEIYVLP